MPAFRRATKRNENREIQLIVHHPPLVILQLARIYEQRPQMEYYCRKSEKWALLCICVGVLCFRDFLLFLGDAAVLVINVEAHHAVLMVHIYLPDGKHSNSILLILYLHWPAIDRSKIGNTGMLRM